MKNLFVAAVAAFAMTAASVLPSVADDVDVIIDLSSGGNSQMNMADLYSDDDKVVIEQDNVQDVASLEGVNLDDIQVYIDAGGNTQMNSVVAEADKSAKVDQSNIMDVVSVDAQTVGWSDAIVVLTAGGNYQSNLSIQEAEDAATLDQANVQNVIDIAVNVEVTPVSNN